MSVSGDQVTFVRAALRDELPDLPDDVLDRAARVGAAATMTWMIEAAKRGDVGEVLTVNADDPLRSE